MLLTLRTPESPQGPFALPPGHEPGAARTAGLPGARAHFFHPGPGTAAVMLEVDPVAEGRPFPDPGVYVSGPLLGRALGRLLPAAAAGDGAPCAVEARISVLHCPEGQALLDYLFGPLGYAVQATRLPVDAQQPRAGASSFLAVTLTGRQRPRDLLSHLRVLLPVFRSGAEPPGGGAEAGALLEEGREWLAEHPAREALERRIRGQVFRQELHDGRHEAVLAALRESGARRVLDLGCGTGALFRRLLEEPRFEEVVGVEVAREELAEAMARLPPGGRGRVLHGSLAYRDARLEGFDAAAVVEVVEHLDPPQLAAMEDAVWAAARPGTVVVTTPNAEYNTLFELHRTGRLRHPDHRFEWTRPEFRAWAGGVAERHGYRVRFGSVGPEDENVGPLTQMAVFTRLAASGGRSGEGDEGEGGIELARVAGERTVATRLGGGVHLGAEEAAAGLEAMSRFAVDPRWLVYLPPSIVPARSAPGTDTLEHPLAALAYYREHGATGAMLQELHSGTRVVAVVCRDAEVARRRFGVAGGETGAVYSARGRPFFATRAAEEDFLGRLRGALESGGVWGENAEEWVALEGVAGPGHSRMPEVDARLHPAPALYWGVATAARETLAAAESALAQASGGEGGEAAALLARTRERAALAAAYATACRRSGAPAQSPRELRFAPVRLLASERGVHAERDARWHLDQLAPACRAAPHTLRGTRHTVVDLTHPRSEAEAVAWWKESVARGSAGVAVLPLEPSSGSGGGEIPAPALKCRGDEALRLVHGPEHTLPENRERLRGRGTRAETAHAAREWALSLEALERFTRGEGLARVHECVLAALGVKTGPRA